MRRLRKYRLLFGLFVLCLAFDAWLYASLARDPVVGNALASSARANAPLLHGYIVLGSPLVKRIGADTGCWLAAAAYADAYPAMVESPAIADSLLFRQSRGPLRGIFLLLYWVTPVLLVLTLGAWVLRSRDTHLMGQARR